MINTMRDILRRPIILLLSTSCLVLIGLLPSFSVFAFGEDERLVRDGVLALHMVFGLLLSGAASATAIYHEVRRGTAAGVLSKPVTRGIFFLATFLGILAVALLFCATMMLAGLLSVRMTLFMIQTDWRIGWVMVGALALAFGTAGAANYWFKRSFTAWAMLGLLPAFAGAFCVCACLGYRGELVQFGSLINWRILPAGILASMAVVVLTALAVAFSTRLPPVWSAAACGMTFLTGLFADYAATMPSAYNPWNFWFWRFWPGWQVFWATDALAGGGAIPWGYVANAGLYTLLYTTGTLTLGWLSFRRIEIM